MLDHHDATVRTIVGRCGGSVIKTTGDGVLALLPSAGVCLRAAAAVRRDLAAEGLDVRIGVHVGDVDLRGDDVSGLASPPPSRSRISRGRALVGRARRDHAERASSSRGYALLTKVLPGVLDPDEIYARLREPFGYWNAVGLTAAMGVPGCLWLGARRDGHARAQRARLPGARPAARRRCCWPTRAARCSRWRSGWRCGSRSCRCACAAWRCSAPARSRRRAWSRLDVRPGRAQRRPRRARGARGAGHQLGALLVVDARRRCSPPGWRRLLPARRAPAEHARPGARRARCIARAARARADRSVAGARAVRPAASAAPSRNAWHSLTDPHARRRRTTPGRLTAVGSVRARYWNEALKIVPGPPVARRRRGGLRDGAPALPHGRPRRAPRPRLRRADARRPRDRRAGADARAARGLARRRAARDGPAPADRGTAVHAGAHGAADAARGRRDLRRALAHRLHVVRAGQRAAGAAGRRLPGRARAARGRARPLPDRCAGGCAPVCATPPRRGRGGGVALAARRRLGRARAAALARTPGRTRSRCSTRATSTEPARRCSRRATSTRWRSSRCSSCR